MLEPGQSFDRYTIEAFLGRGGMGAVYRAYDAKLDRRVALKIVEVADAAPDAEQRMRLIREARAAAKLDHPNAVVIHDVGAVEQTPFIVMELVEGKTLRELLPATPAPALDQKLRWLAETAGALAHAHDRGIVHRDVKPENVMVRPDGSVKVLDFGIARRIAAPVDPMGPTESPAVPTLTTQGTLVGTTTYMSPEQIRGAALDGRSDQFSWAVTAYELLSGKIPWSGEDALSLAASVLTDPVPSLSDFGVPVHVERVVRRALAKSPEDRFGSMHELKAALESRAPDFRRYSTEEVSRVLRRAVDLGAEQRPGLSRADLADVAREVGVPADAVDAALAELETSKVVRSRHRGRARRRQRPKLSAEQRQRRERLRFKRHAATYGLFCLFFIALDALTGANGWAVWPILGWGIAVALHALRIWIPDDDEHAPELAKQGLSDPEVTKSAELLLAMTARRRLRVEPIPDEPPAEEAALEAEPEEKSRARAKS